MASKQIVKGRFWAKSADNLWNWVTPSLHDFRNVKYGLEYPKTGPVGPKQRDGEKRN